MKSIFLALAILLVSSCGENKETTKQPNLEVKEITAYEVLGEQKSKTTRIPGNVKSVLTATIESKIVGRIIKINVKEGQLVKENDSLLEIDAHDIEAKLESAIALEKQAADDLSRFSKLLPAGAVSKQEYDAIETRAKIARAGVEEAKSLLNYAYIKAPFDALVSKKFIEEGDQATPGKPLVQLEKTETYQFEADIPESYASKINLGDELSVFLSGDQREIKGKVSELSPITDPNSRTRHIKLELPNSLENEKLLFHTGQFGFLMLAGHKAEILSIPLSALVERGQIEAVFVISNQKANLRLVRTGKRDANGIEIISGLKSSELIALDPQNLVDGDPIKLK